jgi:hypothetical protein
MLKSELHVRTAGVSYAELHVSTVGVSHAELHVSTAGVSREYYDAVVTTVCLFASLTVLVNSNFS